MSIFNKLLKTAGSFMPDSMIAQSARDYFNRNYSAIGTITSLEINTTQRRASVDLELKGEMQPVHIAIERYELSTSDGKKFIELKEVTASREWIVQLARQCLIGKKFVVPEMLSGILK
jgi:hypothetical protein